MIIKDIKESRIDILDNDETKSNDQIKEYKHKIKDKSSRVLATINIVYNDKDKSAIINYNFNLQKVKSVEEVLAILQAYKEFSNRTIKIGKYKLFGDILLSDDYKKENTDEIDKSIDYWKDVKELENHLSKKFDLQKINNENNKKMLSILVSSFVKNRPCRIDNINNWEITVDDETKLQNIIGQKGDFNVVLDAIKDEFGDVSLKRFCKVIFNGPIKIVDYEIIEKKDKDIRCRLITEAGKDTVSSIMYFKEKKQAEDAIKNHIDDFRKAQYAWQN